MSTWYLAPSLDVLRAEINARWPDRDRTSDGTIGDAAHQASTSDHNPNSRGSVDAMDVDKDGVDVAAIIAAFERHPSAHYWIFNREIADVDDGWRRRPYSGPNPHDKHLHGSIRQSAAAEQDRRPWGLLEDDMTPDQARQLTELHAALLDPDEGMNKRHVVRLVKDLAYVLIQGPGGSTAWVGGALTRIAEGVGIDPAELDAIRAAAREGAASAGDELVAAVLARLPVDQALTRGDVEQAVRDAFAGGLAPSQG